jgi:hypothetical protein
MGVPPPPLPRRRPASRFQPTDGDSPEKVVTGRNYGTRGTRGGGRVEGGSPRRAHDGEGVGSHVDDGDSLDKMLLVAKVWMQAGYKVVKSSSK